MKALTGGDFHAHESVAVARIPPVVPHARFDDGGLALSQDACLPITLDGQLALEHCEALDDPRVTVLANNARPDEGGELGGGSPFRIHVGNLYDLRTLSRDGVLPDFADLYRCEVRRPVRLGGTTRARS